MVLLKDLTLEGLGELIKDTPWIYKAKDDGVKMNYEVVINDVCEKILYNKNKANPEELEKLIGIMKKENTLETLNKLKKYDGPLKDEINKVIDRYLAVPQNNLKNYFEYNDEINCSNYNKESQELVKMLLAENFILKEKITNFLFNPNSNLLLLEKETSEGIIILEEIITSIETIEPARMRCFGSSEGKYKNHKALLFKFPENISIEQTKHYLTLIKKPEIQRNINFITPLNLLEMTKKFN